MKKRILIDFDGVIHAYTSPWTAAAEIADGPVPGVIGRLRQLMDDPDIEPVIFTTRALTEEGARAVYEWLDKHQLFVDMRSRLADPDCMCAGAGYWKHGCAAGEMWPVSCQCVIRRVREDGILVVTAEKLPAHLQIDDRAWRFDGGNFPTRQQIVEFKPWNRANG